MTKRIEFTRKIRAAAIERANGRCQQCKMPFKAGAVEVDHILPCELGGEATLANARAICTACHKAKTADDVRRIRKSDRQRDKATGAVRPKGKMQSRGFDRKPVKPKEPLPPRNLFAAKEG